jgi:hypothetical protein
MTEAEDLVRTLEARRIGSMLLHDLEALAEVLDDRLTYVHSSGVVDNRRAYLHIVETRNLVYHSAEITDTSLLIADGLIVQQGHFRAEIDRYGEPKSLSNFFTDVWVRRDDRWKLILWQSTALPK